MHSRERRVYVMLLKMHTRIGYSPTVNLEYLHLLARTLREGNVFQRLMNYLRKKKDIKQHKTQQLHLGLVFSSSPFSSSPSSITSIPALVVSLAIIGSFSPPASVSGSPSEALLSLASVFGAGAVALSSSAAEAASASSRAESVVFN